MTENDQNQDNQSVQVDQKQDRTWAMLCHLAALAGFILPFGNIIGPLVVWLVKKDEMPQVDEEGKSALNFQISMSIYMVVAAFTIFIIIGFLLVPALAITNVVLVVIAAVKTNNGEKFDYPLSLHLIK
ncbi:MAG: DUF4870 domain-containing protein [Candidatus Omnitrophica bacterium]|nr:DUF4870 domain-containing protein [Candidatus Omnitrophota bacterium]